MSLDDDDMRTTPDPFDGPADGGANPGAQDGGADGTADTRSVFGTGSLTGGADTGGTGGTGGLGTGAGDMSGGSHPIASPDATTSNTDET